MRRQQGTVSKRTARLELSNESDSAALHRLASLETFEEGRGHSCESGKAENADKPDEPRWRRIVDAGPILLSTA